MSKTTSIILAILFCTQVFAVNQVIGDKDGFGFTSLAGLVAYDGGSVDRNGNGILDAGDLLPDLDGDGLIAVIGAGGGDVFDHRGTSELWTDVSLANEYSPAPGGDCWKANDASFTFSFSPTAEDHILSLMYADYDTDIMEMVVEGQAIPLKKAILDGEISLARARISGLDMLDGQVLVEITAVTEPYIVFDHVSLTPIPAPGALILGGIGIGLVGLLRRKKLLNTGPTSSR